MTIATAGGPPGIHKFPGKQNHFVPLPSDDVTILQNTSECPCGRFNWRALKSLRSALKLGQIISAIVILVLIHFRQRRAPVAFDAFPEVPYTLFTFNTMVATVLLLGDSLLTARPLRRVFTPLLWFQTELLFTGLAAMVHQVLAYYVWIMTYQYYGVDVNRIASAFGLVSAGLYLVDWWNNFGKRHEIIREMQREVDGRAVQGDQH